MSSNVKLGKILKANIPEFMQGMKNLDEYLDTSAEVLGDVFDGINDLRHIKSYDKSKDSMVDINLIELGFDVPVNVKMKIKRQVLRDLAEVHLRGATEDGIAQLLRIAEIEPAIHKGWLLNPEMAKKGYHRDYFTRDVERFTPNDRVYMDFLYGETIDTPEGTFFEGYEYWDVDKEVKSDRIPIVGEIYDTSGSLGVDNIASTPYIIIRFEDDDIFLVEDEESTDPVTGKTFPYTINERFELLEDIVQFFLIGKYRATTMRIIIEAKLVDVHENLSIAERYKIHVRDTNDGVQKDGLDVYDELTFTSTTTIDDTDIGDTRIFIGQPTPIHDRWWGIDIKVGDNSGEVPLVENWVGLTTVHHIDQLNQRVLIPLLGDMQASVSGLPSDATVNMINSASGASVPYTGGWIQEGYDRFEVVVPSPATKYTFIIERRERNA